MHADGTGLTTIRSDSNDNETPVWSPHGTKIVFYASGNLDVMNTDGSGETQIPGPVSGFPTDWAAIANVAPSVTGVSPSGGPMLGLPNLIISEIRALVYGQAPDPIKPYGVPHTSARNAPNIPYLALPRSAVRLEKRSVRVNSGHRIDLGFFRPGGEEYADENGTFGLAAIRKTSQELRCQAATED